MKTPNASSLGQAIKAAHEERERQEDQETGLPENDKAAKPESQIALRIETVNLSIKVEKSQRLHWLIEAKKQDTTLTDAITEALNARFGTGRPSS